MITDSSLNGSLHLCFLYAGDGICWSSWPPSVSLMEGCSLPAVHVGQAGQSRTRVTAACSYCSAPLSASGYGISLPPLTVQVLCEYSATIHSY